MMEPATIAEASAAVRAVAERGDRLVICGAGTKVACGDRSISTRRLAQVIEYAPADMTITVEAGVTLAEIERITSADQLRLALDPPLYGGRATIGGVLASNDSGPLRMLHGGPRDLVVGMTIVMGDGIVVRSGGRVVKNVAGYGVHRLMVGSGGELGMIAAATLKLQPRPEAMRLIAIGMQDAAAAESLTARLMGGELRPAMIEWVWPGDRFGLSGLAVVLAFEDCREAVAWQLDELLGMDLKARVLDEGESVDGYAWIREWGASATVRAGMPSSAVWRVFRDADEKLALLSHAGSGCVLAKVNAPRESERVQSMVREWGGNVLVPREYSEMGHARLRSGLQSALRMEPV